MAGTFEIEKTSNSQFLFNLKADNGEIVLTSETYVAKAGANAGIASVRANASKEGHYERGMSTDRQHYFVLKGDNGEIIGQSETYASSSGMEKGIAAVKSNAASALVKDLT